MRWFHLTKQDPVSGDVEEIGEGCQWSDKSLTVHLTGSGGPPPTLGILSYATEAELKNAYPTLNIEWDISEAETEEAPSSLVEEPAPAA